jgi:PTS system, glucose-like IIB component
LPLIFAVGVALGLTNNNGVSALAGVVGYVVMLGTMGAIAPLHQGLALKTVMGISTIDTGVFGGIGVGLVAGFLFNKYHNIQLPAYIGFFGGSRFIPIVTAFSAIILGAILSFIWPPIQTQIDAFSHFAAYSNTALAVTIYGVVERLLLPFGLHHIWNVPFYFQIGDFLNSSGQVVHGEITRFFNGDPTSGNLGGGFIFKMFGLPAAAIAIWHTAKAENRVRIGGIMFSAALTSFLTGITEPIEFSFLFVAPILYLIHALFAGSAFLVVYLTGAKLGYTFSHGFIDYSLFFSMDTKPWVVLIIGPIYAIIYYFVFRAVIVFWNLKTPGRESQEKFEEISISHGSDSFTINIINAFGGKDNIKNLDACITRLRVGLNDIKKADQNKIKSLGAAGIMIVGNNMQAVFGTRSVNIKTDIENYLSGKNTDQNQQNPKLMLDALGGSRNVSDIEYCAQTRVRLKVMNESLINESKLAQLGVIDIMKLNEGIFHLIIGAKAQKVTEELKKILVLQT